MYSTNFYWVFKGAKKRDSYNMDDLIKIIQKLVF